MNYQTILTFLAIAEYGSMGKAAKNLNYSQQVVSEHLKQLEKHLQVQLVIRKKGSHQTVLTPEGMNFLPLAQQYKDFHKQFGEKLDEFSRDRNRKILRLAASASAHQYIVSHIVHMLMSMFPEIEVRLSTVELANIPSASDNRAFDAALIFETVAAHPLVETIPLFSEERYILCPSNTTLPDRALSSSELDPNCEILYTEHINNPAYNEWRKQHLTGRGKPYLKVSTQIAACDYLVEPRFWTIMPASIALRNISQAPGKFTFRRIQPSPAPRSCSLLVSKNYPDIDVIEGLLHCFDEYISNRPYLINSRRIDKNNRS